MGTAEARLFAPSKEYDPAVMEWVGRLERTAASPAAAVAFMRLGSELDVRHVAPSIHVPTLVMHAPGDPSSRLRRAAGSPSRSREPASSSSRAGPRALVRRAPIRSSQRPSEFLTGFREAPEPEQILATVLFTDIVGSTERARELGDREWRSLLERHHDHGARDRWPATADGRSIRPATASSRPSTGRRGRSAAPRGARRARWTRAPGS